VYPSCSIVRLDPNDFGATNELALILLAALSVSAVSQASGTGDPDP
jgi:hypothetical protein